MSDLVYFMKAGDAIKIGITSQDVERRRATIQTGSAVPVELLHTISCESRQAAVDMERQLHRTFADLRLEGEWFRAHPRIIESMTAPQREPLAIYLAGKISSDNWREEIVGGAWQYYARSDGRSVIFGTHHYTGPFYSQCKHGCDFKLYSHRVGCEPGETDKKTKISDGCREAIDRSDLVFVYWSDPTAFGTLVEIGYALAKGLDVAVGAPSAEACADIWFAFAMGARGPFIGEPADALHTAIEASEGAK